MKQKKYLWCLLAIMMVAVMSIGFTSCGDDDDDNISETSSSGNSYSNNDIELKRKLAGTSWKIVKKTIDDRIDDVSGTITFTSKSEVAQFYDAVDPYCLHTIKLCGKYNRPGQWWVNNGKLFMYLSYLDNETVLDRASSHIDSQYPMESVVTNISNNSLTLEEKSSTGTIYRYYLSKTSYAEATYFDTFAEGGNSGVNSKEAPRVISFDFTASKTSITVKFMCNERPTSATVKYGTSSPSNTLSSSISAKQVSATATGLKAGTKYYFKCIVKNGNGSSTSDTYPAMTLY